MDKVLIVKKQKGGGQALEAKLRLKVNKGFVPNDYCKVVNPYDYNDLALLFEDLEIIIGAPVERAFRKYKEKKERGFPFY